ncbi:MAG: MFS transporter [Candidatus Riflebacteria bacterium]
MITFFATFRSLQYRNYRLFFCGQTISLIGTWIQKISVPWLVYKLTGSSLLLGTVSFAGQVPTFLLAGIAGVYADRLNRFRILVVTQFLSMIQAILLTALYFSGNIQVWQIVVLSVFLGVINAFDIPARHSFVVEIVEKREDLGNAIALNSSMVTCARLLGPSLAGILIASVGEGVCFLINGFSYLFVILSLIGMKNLPVALKKHEKPVFKELKEGFKYTFSKLPMRASIFLVALSSFFGVPYVVLMPVMTREVLHSGAQTYGFLMGSSGIGALAGALFLASRKDQAGLEKVIPSAAAIFGVGLLLFSYSRSVVLSLFLIPVIGLGMMVQMASSNTLLQTQVDDQMRGRVLSFYTMAFMGTVPFGSFVAGMAADQIGAPLTLRLGGVFCLIGSWVYLYNLGKIRAELSQN